MTTAIQAAKSHGHSGMLSRLTWAGVLAGAIILTIHSFSGQAVEQDKKSAAPMVGESLSALHSAIPRNAINDEPVASF